MKGESPFKWAIPHNHHNVAHWCLPHQIVHLQTEYDQYTTYMQFGNFSNKLRRNKLAMLEDAIAISNLKLFC